MLNGGFSISRLIYRRLRHHLLICWYYLPVIPHRLLLSISWKLRPSPAERCNVMHSITNHPIFKEMGWTRAFIDWTYKPSSYFLIVLLLRNGLHTPSPKWDWIYHSTTRNSRIINEHHNTFLNVCIYVHIYIQYIYIYVIYIYITYVYIYIYVDMLYRGVPMHNPITP